MTSFVLIVYHVVYSPLDSSIAKDVPHLLLSLSIPLSLSDEEPLPNSLVPSTRITFTHRALCDVWSPVDPACNVA